jgi:hypothetical protein
MEAGPAARAGLARRAIFIAKLSRTVVKPKSAYRRAALSDAKYLHDYIAQLSSDRLKIKKRKFHVFLNSSM